MKKLFRSKGLIVSCQALPGEPLHGGDTMAKMAIASELAGAIGIRGNGPDDITKIRNVTNLPIIGLFKRGIPGSEIYITPTIEEVKAIIAAGADIVALDMTNREERLSQAKSLVDYIHRAGVYVMADISTLDEGLEAEKVGADLISTTLSGYTSYSPQQEEPDFQIIHDLNGRVKVPIVAEGRIATPEQALNALKLGAEYVVVGSAITRPQCIAANFVKMIDEYLG